MSASAASSRCAAIFFALSASLREIIAVAAPPVGVERDAYVPSPYGVLSVSPSTTLMSVTGMPSSSATICANVVSWPWPCDFTPSLRIALPVGWTRSSAESIIFRPRMSYVLRRARADRFGEVRDADAHQLAVGARRDLLLAQVLVADCVERLAQRGRVVAGVVHEPGRCRVRELLGLDEVLEPHVGRVDAELVGRRLHQSFDEVRRLGDAERTAVRDATGRLVRVRAAARDVRGRVVVAAGDDVEEAGAELRRLRVGVERALVGEHVRRATRGCGRRSCSASSPFM